MQAQLEAEAFDDAYPEGAGKQAHTEFPLPANLRACVWLQGQHFSSHDDALANCWLWLLGEDGRVHALRMDAAGLGRVDRLHDLLIHLNAHPETPYQGDPALGTVWPLSGAPVVPVPRWRVSWGHPLQKAIREFADQLDAEVLAALGQLEVPGPFFGSVGNYNRLALLPQRIREHRLQALRRFPPLLAPLILDVYGRPSLFGSDEDEPAHRACFAPTASVHVLDAMDRGRDLIGALVSHYRVDRALVRSAMFREPWKSGLVPRSLLHLLCAIPAHARPRVQRRVEEQFEWFAALPLSLQTREDIKRAASAFASGWDKTWQHLKSAWQPLQNNLHDTRDFLRAALEQAALPAQLAWLDMEALALAWLARRGIVSLLAASRRWHQQPLIERTSGDGLPDALEPLFGTWQHANGRATELLTRHALIEEGRTMNHCVGDYWSECVLEPKRIVHLQLTDGSTATAQFQFERRHGKLAFVMSELRGPCNVMCSKAMFRFAQDVERMLDAEACCAKLVDATREAMRAKAEYHPGARRTLRRLDRKSCVELAQVLAYIAQQADWMDRPQVLFNGAIAGFGYSYGPNLRPRLDVGDALQLVREPRNPHDENAVRIDWNGHKLGYVPQRHNEAIALLLDAGELPRARISKLHDHLNAPVECRIERVRVSAESNCADSIHLEHNHTTT